MGGDFAYAAFAFADQDRIVRQDHRFSYGEDRYELIVVSRAVFTC